MQDVTLVGFCGAAFYDLRSGLHRRFLEQISNRPNRHCGDIRDGGPCLKKNAFRTHTTCMDYIAVKALLQRVGWLGRVLRLADRAPQRFFGPVQTDQNVTEAKVMKVELA